MRIVVTGGSGFIGAHVVEALLARGHEPVVADRQPSGHAAVERLTGDLRDPGVVAAAVAPGTDAVVHLAATTSVLRSTMDPHGVYANNVAVTEALLERSREVGVRSFVLASTVAVCGDVGTSTLDEAATLRPLTPYGASKAACEMLASAYSASYGLRTVALRFTSVYGPGMHGGKEGIVAKLLRAALHGGTVPIYGSGEQTRDHLYVTDAAAAVVLALGLPASGVLVVGTGRSVSVNALLQLAREATGVPIAAEHVEAKAGEMPAVLVDTRRARAAGFVPRWSLEAGLAETWEQLRTTRAA